MNLTHEDLNIVGKGKAGPGLMFSACFLTEQSNYPEECWVKNNPDANICWDENKQEQSGPMIGISQLDGSFIIWKWQLCQYVPPPSFGYQFLFQLV